VITANGSGSLTGELDSNSNKGASGLIAFTGYYTVDTSNIGLMTILPSVSGQPAFNFAFSADGPTPYQNLQFIRYDDTDVTGSGTGTTDIGAGFATLRSSISLAAGSWVFGFTGETPCTTLGGTINTGTCNAGTPSPYGPLSAAGVFTVDGSSTVTGGEEDASGMCPQSASDCTASNYNASFEASSYINADSTGRGSITLTSGDALYPNPPSHFIYYVVSSTEIVMMSSDSHATNSLVGGDVVLQQGTIGNSTLANGATLIPYGLSANNGDGASVYATQSGAQVVLVTVTNPDNSTNCSGSPSFGVFIYQNNGGNYQAKAQGTQCVSVAGNGRLTFTGAGDQAPVGYVASSSFGFLSQQVSSAGNSPGLLRSELQTATAFSSTSCDMIYGTLPPPVPMTVDAGYVSSASCPATAYSSTEFSSSSYGLLESGSGTLNTSAPNSSGVITGVTDDKGNNRTIVVISGTKGLVLDANQGETTPFLNIVQQ